MCKRDGDRRARNILMIGNSFCYSFVEALWGMARTLGHELCITNLYRGGCSIKSHYTWLQDPAVGAGKCEYFITDAQGRRKHPTVTTLAEALGYATWDVITCQQHFDVARTLDFGAGYDSCMPWAEDMFRDLRCRYPGARLCWQETWAYAVGYQHPDNRGGPFDANRKNGDVPNAAVQTRQQEVIRAVSKTVCAQCGVDMIPTGDAWTLARSRLGDTLTKADCCHDGDVGGGQYLNACVWLEVLTGESCLGNTWRPDNYVLPEEKIPVLQACAHEAVAAICSPDLAK